MTLRAVPAASAAVFLAATAAAASPCHQLAADAPRIVPASLALGEGEVGISFVGHATFRIETAGGVVAVTDYSGFYGEGRAPDVATMNHAHETHWTAHPDPAIAHVLRGWNPEGGPAEHYLQLGDLVVRNVPTDIRTWGGDVEPYGNSIFVFEVGDLCIGHLGHLHHEPTEEHYALLGRLDVVMAPVDGGYTMNLPAMIRVLERLKARVVLPMHWFGESNLERFLAGMSATFDVREAGGRSATFAPDALPARPTVVVLR